MAQGAATRSPGAASTTNSGSRPNETAYGAQDHTVDLSHALYDHALATATRCTSPATIPVASDSTTHRAAATSAAACTCRVETSPATTGLSARCTATSRRASSQSLDQPTES